MNVADPAFNVVTWSDWSTGAENCSKSIVTGGCWPCAIANKGKKKKIKTMLTITRPKLSLRMSLCLIIYSFSAAPRHVCRFRTVGQVIPFQPRFLTRNERLTLSEPRSLGLRIRTRQLGRIAEACQFHLGGGCNNLKWERHSALAFALSRRQPRQPVSTSTHWIVVGCKWQAGEKVLRPDR